MSTKLNYKAYNTYGGNTVHASDLLGSGDWIHAGTKTGLDKQTVTSIFDYWQNSPYLNVSRFAQGKAGRGQGVINTAPGPIGGGGSQYDRVSFAKQTAKDFDPFDLFRSDYLSKINLNFNVGQDGTASYYKPKEITEYLTNPLTSTWSTNKPGVQRQLPSFLQGSSAAQNSVFGQPATRTRKDINQRGQQVTGRILNNAFIDDESYGLLSEEGRKFYGLTNYQAQSLDPKLAASNQLVDAAYQYRRGRSRKKTGLNAAIVPAISAGLALSGVPAFAAIGSGVNTANQGGGLSDILTSGLKGYAGAGGFKGANLPGVNSTPGFNPDGFGQTTTGNNNVSIWDSLKNFNIGGFDIGDLTSVFNPSSSGGSSVWGSFGGSSGSSIFDKVNGFLDSPIGQIGTNLLGGYLGNKESNEYQDRLKNAAQGAEFNPYNAQGPGGGVTYNNGQATTYLSPAMQALASQLQGAASGNINAFNSYDPAQQAAQQFDILENIAQPYREKERDSLTSRLINQGVYNPGASEGSPGYWQPRYLEDSINASRDKNLFDSYNLAQNTATNTLNRGIGATNLLESINYGPLAYAGLGSQLGSAQSNAYATGIPYIADAAAYDRNSDSTIFNSLLNSLGRRV